MKKASTVMFLLLLYFAIVSADSGMLKLPDGSIYFESAGNGEALILLHGGFGDRRMWDDQFDYFAKSYRVVRYDQRGFGKSPSPGNSYSPVADLEALMDHLKIERAHLVGNSMGGSLAIDFAILKPAKVQSISVVASGPNGIEVPKEDMERMMVVFKTAKEQGLQPAADLWIQSPMVAVTSKLPATAPLLKKMIDENAGIFKMQYWPVEKLDPPSAKRLSEIKVPALIIIGGKDTAVVKNLGEIAASEIPNARRVVIDGADHLPQMATPDEFNQILSRFLKERSER